MNSFDVQAPIRFLTDLRDGTIAYGTESGLYRLDKQVCGKNKNGVRTNPTVRRRPDRVT